MCGRIESGLFYKVLRLCLESRSQGHKFESHCHGPKRQVGGAGGPGENGTV